MADNHFHNLVFQASNQIRQILKIDYLSYQITDMNLQDPRKYFIHNVLNEIEKAYFAVQFEWEFFLNNKDESTPSEEDKQLNSQILQSKIDQLSLWKRKLIEILIDTLLFKGTNKIKYYAFYNLLYMFRKEEKYQSDRKEFWNCDTQSAGSEICRLQSIIETLRREVNFEKCWFAEIKKKSEIVLTSTNKRFKEALEKAKKYQKIFLISYQFSFGKTSEFVHPKMVLDSRINSFAALEQLINEITILSLLLLSALKDLLNIHNINGPLKQVSSFKTNKHIDNFLKLRVNPQLLVGDYVITPKGPAQIIKKISSKYGYKTFQVKHFLNNIEFENDQYIGEEILILAPLKEMRKKTLSILQQTSPGIKVKPRELSSAIRESVLDLWMLIQNKGSSK